MREQDSDLRHRCRSLKRSRRARVSSPIGLVFVATLAATAALLSHPPAAAASPSIRYGIQDDAYFSAGPSLENDATQRWLQFELLPSLEQYGSPCSARWIVFYDSTAVPEGVEIGKVSTFKPGYALAPVASTCTS